MIAFDRRQIVSGIGAGALVLGVPAMRAGAQNAALTWRLQPATEQLGGRPAPVFSINPPGPLRARRGDTLQLDVVNGLPVTIAANWYGLDGVAALAPLTAQPPIAAGSRAQLTVPLRQAGTFLCDFRLLGDRQARPLPATVVVAEDAAPVADRDEVLLFEEWRLTGDNVPMAPATSAEGARPLFTVNGRNAVDISMRANERLRLRLVNACQRSIVAVKIMDHAATVMAIDGAPADPFPAREGEVILSPGSRVDTIVDGRSNMAGGSTEILLHDGVAPRVAARLVYDGVEISRPFPPSLRPLPSDWLPDRIDLQRALRVEMPFDGSAGDWLTPGDLGASVAPAFRVRRGRAVVLTLTNRATAPAVFHLHGHHARLLDRLDDGWKPFWLDTITVAPGQTQRIAFVAETGAWLFEGMRAQWSAPRLARWFSVET